MSPAARSILSCPRSTMCRPTQALPEHRVKSFDGTTEPEKVKQGYRAIKVALTQPAARCGNHSAPPCGTEPPEGYGGWRWLKRPRDRSPPERERPLQGDWPWLMNYRFWADRGPTTERLEPGISHIDVSLRSLAWPLIPRKFTR